MFNRNNTVLAQPRMRRRQVNQTRSWVSKGGIYRSPRSPTKFLGEMRSKLPHQEP